MYMKINSKYFFLLMAIIGIAGCNRSRTVEDLSNNAITVITQQVKRTSSTKEISVSGNIEGNKTVRLGFMVAGKINFIAAEEGQSISAGQLLASLDSESYGIAKEMADANLDQTQDEYNRLNQMHERQSISESDFSKITNALKVAKAQQRLQAKNLIDTKLYSPINGVLLKKGAEVGEIIGIGLPLFAVSDIHIIKVNASVPESDLHQVLIGNEAKVFVSSLDSSFIGKVTEIGSVAEATTRTFTVKIELQNPNLLIRPGMTAEVKIISGKKTETTSIPANAILHDVDNSSYVFIADTLKKQAFKRKVSLGQIIGDNIEIISGLSQNEVLIIGGQNKVSNGSSITIK